MISLRAHNHLFEMIRHDLRRPHDFAAERVGFLWARPPPPDGSCVEIAVEYVPLADDDYVEDRWVGARFGSRSIRTALERTLETGDACFHIHMHDHEGRPGFSGVDMRSMLEFVPPFAHLAPAAVHGALVLSSDDVAGAAWLPGSGGEFAPLDVSVIGFPLQLSWRIRDVE